jgi:Secretion system C-terminal sorting domain
MKRAWSVICMLVLVLTMAATVSAEKVSPLIDPQTEMTPKANDELSLGQVVHGQPMINELDEQVGDTIHIGNTARDMQHNGTLGRMIVAENMGDDGTMFHYAWTFREGPQTSSLAYYKSAMMDAEGVVTVDPAPQQVYQGGGNWGAYIVADVDEASSTPVVAFHGNDAYFDFNSVPNAFVPGLWNNNQIPALVAPVTMWPHSDGDNYLDTYYMHNMLNEYDPENNGTELYYNRMAFNPGASLFTNATPGGENQLMVTDYAMNLSNALAISDDGSKITLAQTSSRYLMLGEGGEWDGLALSQGNNDIYLWESVDGGESWEFGEDNAQNVTNWLPPNLNALPDTILADQDSLRAYTEIDLHYDGEDVLHMAFNTPIFRVVSEEFYTTNRLFYWNSAHGLFTQIQDGTFWNSAGTATWENVVGNANLYKDDETGVLWCAFVQHGVPGDTLTEGDDMGAPRDASITSGQWMKATDVFVTGSPDDGLHWATPVNVTNTRNEGANLIQYETESEREMSMASNSDGEFLHLFYTIDYDPGVAVPADPAVGEPTDNIQIHQMVPKDEMIVLFDENASWVRNYPIHIDSTNFYDDPNDWAYPEGGFFGTSVGESKSLSPDQFELEQNYPNPFNPSTQIAFSLSQPGKIKLAVYDILGREVATLINRGMSAGSHTVNFHAGDMASGVYFYSLTSGDVTKTQKMVLMK